ncbi:tetratricopeptide repeat protein [Candidatus Kuenenia sp.]|uniref:tetratricopeptide repeat-containing S1 family peptidase n=1 Tax=Candidatus Kuenenia sp. TaxID=2499824 RepID=UPI00321F8BEB
MNRCFQNVILGAIFVFVTAGSACVMAQDAATHLANKIKPAVVSLTSVDKDGNEFNQGGGFIINELGDIITHSKVFMGAHSIRAKNFQGNNYSVTKILAEDKEGGLVQLAIDNFESRASPLPLALAPPEVNEQIMVINNSFDSGHFAVTGVVTGISEIPVFGTIIRIKASFSLGCIGSPLINMNGEAVGIMAFISTGGEGYALACERLKNLVPVKDQSFSERRGLGEISEEAFYGEGILLIGNEEYEKAISLLEKAISKDRNYAHAYFQIGYCKNKLGNYPDAIKNLKQAIRLKPEFPEGCFQLGMAYFMQKQYQGAVESLLDAVRSNAQFFEAYFMLGLAYTALERHRDAIEAYWQAIRINKDVPEVHFHLGMAYLQTENKLMAYEEYKVLKNLNKHLASKLFKMIYQ